MKGTYAVLGALAGACGCGIVTLLIWLTLHKPPTHDNWDYVSPIVIFGTSLLSAVVGLLAGGYVGWRLASGDRSAWRIAGAVGGLAVAAPLLLYIALFQVRPRASVSVDRAPATPRERRQRAQDKQGIYFNQNSGLQLALQIDSCAGGPSLQEEYLRTCEDLASWRAHQEPPPPQWYMAHDHGWRWMDTTYQTQHHIVVFPDPLTGHEGPVFEVRENGLLVRRERPESPAHAVVEDLAVADAFRRCLLDVADKARTEGRWDGDWQVFPAYVARAACPGLRISAIEPRNEYHPDRATVRFAQSSSGSTEIDISPVDGGFELRGRFGRRQYLIDAQGRWHVTPEPGRRADITDPPPPACAVNLRVAC